jgi:hypothetical protein
MRNRSIKPQSGELTGKLTIDGIAIGGDRFTIKNNV